MDETKSDTNFLYTYIDCSIQKMIGSKGTKNFSRKLLPLVRVKVWYLLLIVSSMIHSAWPTVSPVANIVFTWNLFCFEKWGRTDGRVGLVDQQYIVFYKCKEILNYFRWFGDSRPNFFGEKMFYFRKETSRGIKKKKKEKKRHFCFRRKIFF